MHSTPYFPDLICRKFSSIHAFHYELLEPFHCFYLLNLAAKKSTLIKDLRMFAILFPLSEFFTIIFLVW